MTTISSRSRLAAAVSPLAIGLSLVLGSSAAYAQDVPPPVDPAAEVPESPPPESSSDTGPTPAVTEEDEQAIVVTGFRASLQNAINKKKRSDQIVESVSAEDIGKLPDASIAESIARLPGLTAQRLSGRANVISIRGFGPDYSTTLLNGREQTSTGDNRAVEFDQYPSEVMSRVDIYKTPMASIIGQGIAGTVDLRTIRPLEYGRQVISVGARAVYSDIGKLNPDSDKYGYRVNGTYVGQFADDTIGVSLSASWNDEPYQLEEFNAWGYAPVDADTVVIAGAKPYVTSTQLKRLGLAGTLEFKPTDTITSTIDGFYSNFKDDQIKRGIELPLFWGGAPLTITSEEDGVVTSGTFTNVQSVVRNVNFQRHAKLYSFGWNNRYDGGNGWRGMLDISYSKTDRNELIFETWGGTGFREAGVGDNMGFETTSKGTTFTHQLDYSDPNLILLTDMNGWGGEGYSNDRIVDDRIWQYHGQIGKDLNTGFLSRALVGANWTNHDKSLTPDEHFIRLASGATSMVLPEEFRKKPTQLDYLGLGPMLSYDPLELLKAGIYTLESNNEHLDVRAKAYDIHEDLRTLYLQFDINAMLGATNLTGNVGVQATHTEQTADGLLAGNGVLTPVSETAKYWDVMPSLNLSARLPSDFVVRLGLAREVMRPRMDSMRSALSYFVNQVTGPGGENLNFIEGNSGEPRLRPFRANAADLSFEKYFGIKGYVAAQLFYKYFDTFVVETNLPLADFDFTGFPLPAPWQSTNPLAPNYITPEGIANGLLRRPFNVKGGKMYGIEIAGTLPIGELVPALEGFGVTGGVSYTKSRVRISEDADPSDLPGYSKWVANGTAYFEKWGFSMRGSVRHRSSFIGDFSGFGANRVQRRARPETIIDGQVGYEFQPGSMLSGLSIYLQGQNLTDEPFVSQNPGAPLQVIDYQSFGRRYLAGFNYKFGAAAPMPPPPPVVAPPPPPPEPPPATQTCPDGSVILATDACPAPPPPPPPPAPEPERG
jgi:iron complex outermembrane receptor protein